MQKYSGLIPQITVKSGAAAIDFYKAAFGAEELSRMPAPDGRVMHAHLKIEGSSLFLSDDFPDHCGGVSRLPSGPLPLTLHVCVKDCDAAIARAVKAGATVQMPATDMFWGDRYGQIVDPFGYTWSLSHPLSAEQAAAAQKAWAGMKPNK
ncbi:MAG TPA: VOC family protein [Gemmataceae bacterium]|jgi:PhnB protein